MATWYEDYLHAWNERDAERVASFFAEELDFEDVGLGHTLTTRAEMRASAVSMFEQMGDMRLGYVGGHELGDRYYYEWTMEPMGGRGVSVGQRRDGLVIHNRDYWCMPTAQ